MNNLKELVDKIYLNVMGSDLIVEYPEYSDKKMLGYELESIALDIIPNFIPKDKMNEFIAACDKNFNEFTFKKYIKNYSKFLNQVESDFYNGLSL